MSVKIGSVSWMTVVPGINSFQILFSSLSERAVHKFKRPQNQRTRQRNCSKYIPLPCGIQAGKAITKDSCGFHPEPWVGIHQVRAKGSGTSVEVAGLSSRRPLTDSDRPLTFAIDPSCHLVGNGAVERTRTSTVLLPPAP